jgi:hypothetical protein
VAEPSQAIPGRNSRPLENQDNRRKRRHTASKDWWLRTPGLKTRERDGKFIGGFPLGIGEPGKRQWLDVYVSADRARTLQEQVEQGIITKQSEIVVVGFPKEKTIEQEGKAKTKRWINAVAISPKE